MTAKRYVFLSYGRKDVYPTGATNPVEQEQHFPLVEKVYHHLNGLKDALGLEPWFDKRCLTHDRPFTDSIHQAIEQSDYLLLFIGAHSLNSEWCEREWKHALRHCVPVIPILLQGKWHYKCITKTYPPRILGTSGIDPRRADKSLDDQYLLKEIVNAVQQKPAALALPINAKKLPDHYIDRPQSIDDLKKRLGVNDRDYKAQSNIVGITSKQESAALQGVGGIGKTTLALALCNDCDVRRAFDHIFWLEAGPDVKAEAAPGLMRVIGTHFGDNPELYNDLQTARALLQKHLSNKRSLLVLDDVWHEGLKEQFSLAGLDLRLVVTTRQKRLVDNPETVDKLSPEEGLRLLATLFNPANPDPASLTADHRAIVTELDGYTLALEIAGKWLIENEATPAYYLQKLHSSESALFDDPDLQLSESDKNKNLAVSLSLSYNALKPDDQRRFRTLGLFAPNSSFSLEALNAVWGMDDARMAAQTLVKLGLLEREALTPDPSPSGRGEAEATVGDAPTPSPVHGGGPGWGFPRYTQHTLLRAYALLTRAGETEGLFLRFVDFYTQLADQFFELPPERWGALDDNLPNIHLTGDELVKQTDSGQSGDLERALAFAYNVTRYLFRRRQVRRIEWTEMGLNAARALQTTATDKTLYRRRESLFLNELGMAWDALGEKRRALEFYERALPLFSEVGDRGGEAATLNNIGGAWSALGEKRRALEFYERALPLRREVGDRGGEATTLNNIGGAWDALGEKRRALEFYERALPLSREVGDRGGEATTFNNVGGAWDALGEKRKALEFYQRALPLFSEVGDRGGEATTLNNIGGAWDALGEKRKALEFYERALPLSREVGDRGGEATTLNNIGIVYDALGEKRKALEYFERALPLSREVGDRGGEATTLNNIGGAWSALGEKRRALEFYERALPLSREVGDRGGEATTLNNIGLAWDALGEKRRALEFYERALPLRREVGDRGGEATTLNNIGLAWDALGEKRRALEFYERALPLRREVGDRGGEATTLNNIGLAWSALGEKRRALEFYERALPLRREVGDRGGEAVTCFNMGTIYESFGDLDQAIAYVSRCVELDKQVEHPDLASDTAYLEHLIRKRDGGEPPPQPSPEYRGGSQDETAQALAAIARLYREQGEDGLRAALHDMGMPADMIEQVVALVKH